MDQSSARITNELFSTEEVPVEYGNRTGEEREEDVPYDRFFAIASVWFT